MTCFVTGFVVVAADIDLNVVVCTDCCSVSVAANVEVVVACVVFVVTALSADFVLHSRFSLESKFLTIVVVDFYFDVVHFATVEVVFVLLVVPTFELLLPVDLHLSVLCF